VVMLGDDLGPAPHRVAAASAGTQPRDRPRPQQRRPRADARWRHEIGGEALPAPAIALAQRGDPALLGVIGGGLGGIEDEEGAAPPADLVVAEISQSISGKA